MSKTCKPARNSRGSRMERTYTSDMLTQSEPHQYLTLPCACALQALQLIREHNLVLGDLSTTPSIDLTIDGSDEITADLDCIKVGAGTSIVHVMFLYGAAVVAVCTLCECSLSLSLCGCYLC